MTASLFVQGLINGLNQGAIYALIALGYTMVYGIIRMINFAHGDFIMIGAYTLFYTIPLMVDAGMPAWMAVIVAVAVCALVGVLVEILAYRPVRKAGPMSALITALAMSIFLENLAMVLFGTTSTTGSVATIEALTSGAQTFEMVFEGVNEAATGKTVTVTVHRAKIGAAQGLGFIGDDFGALEITGEVLIDTSIVTAGLSQFFKVEMDVIT